MSKSITGKAYWAKILGQPGKAYNPGERQWSMDLSLDKAGLKEAKAAGIANQVKEKGKEWDPFITFVRREFKKANGKPNQPIEVVSPGGEPWPSDSLIGNGSKVTVEFNTYEIPAFGGNPPYLKPAILRVTVLEHVPFTPQTETENADKSGSDPDGEPWDVV